MKRVLYAFAASALIFSSSAFATVIDFESTGTPNAYNNLDYPIDGFRFNFTMDNIDLSANWWAGTGPAHSGIFAGLNNYGGIGSITRDDHATFAFNGLWVKNWFDSTSRVGTITGLLNGNVVAQMTANSSGDWSHVAANFTNIDTLNFDFGNYFLVDDISLNNATPPNDVPEPGSLALFGLGAAALMTRLRRKSQA